MLITASELIQRSIHLYTKNFRAFLPYLLLLFFSSSVWSIIILIFQLVRRPSSDTLLYTLLFIAAVIVSAAIICSLWFSIIFVRALSFRYQGKNIPPLSQELQATKILIWPALVSSILTLLAYLGGFFLFIIPGIIFVVWFSFAFSAVAIDETRALPALRLSKSLVQGRWWAVFWRLLVPLFIFFIILFLTEKILSISLSYFLIQIAKNNILLFIVPFIFSLITIAINLICAPFSTAASVILYLEMKKMPSQTSSTKPNAT